MNLTAFRALLCFAIAAAGVVAADAQTLYRCSTVSGSTYVSEQPCSQSGDPYVHEPGAPASREIPFVVDIAPLKKYMSPRCGSLLDALRSARESHQANVAETTRNYYRECNQEELEAANRLAAEQKQGDLQRKGKP